MAANEQSSQETVVVGQVSSKLAEKNKSARLPPYNVVLFNDDDHTYEYVIEMLKVVFAYADERGFELAKEVDRRGRVVVMTTHKERAELKRDQIHSYGIDARVATCSGSMSAAIEPAEG